jgi:PadR family transcriptional regulator PadR
MGQGPVEHHRANRRARVYDITAAGRRQLETEESRWRAVTAAIGHVLKHA